MDKEVSVLFTARDATAKAFASIRKSLGSVGDAFENVEKRFRTVGREMRDMGAGLSLAVTAPLVLFGKSAIDAASEAAEMESAFDQTFKGSAAAIRAWADETAPAINRSTTELESGALRFGQLFTQVTDQVKAADLSSQFSLLAQDAASFFNTDIGTAVDKLRSGLSGESEPLRDFGVFLTEAQVKAEGLKMGLSGANDELTEQEKVLVRAQVILQQMSAAQGDAARTSGSYENSLRGMSAAFGDLQRTIGTELLPIATQVVQAITSMVRWFSGLPEPVRKASLVFAGLAAVVGPLVTALGLMALAIGTVGVPVAAVIAGIAALTAAVVAFWPEIQAAGAAIQTFLSGAWAGFVAAWDGMVEKVRAVGVAIVQFTNDILSAFAALPGQMLEIGGQIIDGLWQGIQAKWETLKAGVSDIASGIKSSFTSFFDIHSPSRVMHDVGADIIQGLANGMSSLQGQVNGVAVQTAEGVKGAFDDLDSIGQTLSSSIGEVFAGIIKGGDEAKDAIKNLVSELGKMFLNQGLQALGSALGLGNFGTVLSSIFTPRARGGNVSPAGGPYMTGEEGVEIFQPGRSGRIINHDDVQEIVGGRYSGRRGERERGGNTFRGGDLIIQGDVSEKNLALIRQEIGKNNERLAYAQENGWR